MDSWLGVVGSCPEWTSPTILVLGPLGLYVGWTFMGAVLRGDLEGLGHKLVDGFYRWLGLIGQALGAALKLIFGVGCALVLAFSLETALVWIVKHPLAAPPLGLAVGLVGRLAFEIRKGQRVPDGNPCAGRDTDCTSDCYICGGSKR